MKKNLRSPYPQAKAIAKIPTADKSIISTIISEFVNRSRKEIKDWRNGQDAADNPEKPRWVILQDLFEYLRPDGHLGSQMGIRKGATVSNRFYVKGKDGKEDEEKTALLKKKWFKNMMKDLLDNIFLAYTVLQITELTKLPNGKYDLKYDLIPRRNVVPQLEMILFEVGGDKGVKFTDPAFEGSIIFIRNQDNFGILNDLVPDLIWKRNARQAWAEFGERFGLPMVTATTNKSDKAEIDRLEYMLQQLAGAARAVLPMGTTIDIKETGTGDPHKVFLEQMVYSDGQISKRILGGTMISDNGSSRSQSEVHQDTLSYIISEDDRTDIEFTVNDQLMPILVAAGIGLQEGDEFIFDRSEDLSMKEHWDIVNAALAHYEIEDEWVSNTFNIPITGRKAQPKAGGGNFFE